MDTDVKNKLARLKTILAGIARNGQFALAYSGGLDSRFLAHAAALASLDPILLHVHGPHIAADENRYAREQGGTAHRERSSPVFSGRKRGGIA